MVFDFVDGRPLVQTLAPQRWRRGWDDRRAVAVLASLAGKLAAIHATGLAIGDFALGHNILVRGQTDPVWCDITAGWVGVAPGGCDQWAVCRHFHVPALVLFPAIDMAGIHRLVDGLFAPDPETFDPLVTLLLAEAWEVEAGSMILAPDLMAHAGLSDRVELVPFPDHLLLRAPGRA